MGNQKLSTWQSHSTSVAAYAVPHLVLWCVLPSSLLCVIGVEHCGFQECFRQVFKHWTKWLAPKDGSLKPRIRCTAPVPVLLEVNTDIQPKGAALHCTSTQIRNASEDNIGFIARTDTG